MKSFFKKLILIFLILVFVLSFNKSPIKISRIDNMISADPYPGSPTFMVKRLKEKIITSLSVSASKKSDYLLILLDVRLVELNFTVIDKSNEQIENASSRYSYYAGLLTEAASDLDEQQKSKIMEKFRLHSEFLPTLRDKFPSNSAYWLVIQQNIDALQILSDKL